MKIIYFFLFSWVIFALPDPDPDPATQINADPYGSGSTTLVELKVMFESPVHLCDIKPEHFGLAEGPVAAAGRASGFSRCYPPESLSLKKNQ
jgi:hypothetical protein